MLNHLTLRFPKKHILILQSRSSAEDTPVNTLTEKLLDGALRTTSPNDAWTVLQAVPAKKRESLYRKVVRWKSFERQPLKAAELRQLPSGAQNRNTFPDEALSRICTPARLKLIFSLVIRAQDPGRDAMKAWVATTGLVTSDLSLMAAVAEPDTTPVLAELHTLYGGL